jgi:hypothetical protein
MKGRRAVFRLSTKIFSLFLIINLLAGCANVKPTDSKAFTPPPVADKGPPKGHVIGVKQFLPVRADASFKANTVGRLEPGASVTIRTEDAEWYLISGTTSKGLPVDGWVQQNYIEKEPPAQVPPASDNAQSQEEVTKMKQRTTAEGTVLGALAGAGAGAVLALLLGDRKNMAAYIAGGAALGGAAGYAMGTYVANKKENYKNTEDYLDACIKEAFEYNQSAQETNRYFEETIQLTQMKIDKIKSEIKDAGARKMAFKNETDNLRKASADCDSAISKLEGELQAQEKAITGCAGDKTGKVSELEKQLVTMRKQLDDLKAKRNRLADMTNATNKMS